MTTRAPARWRRFLCRSALIAIPALGATLACSESDAFAQGWLADRQRQDGEGLRTGDFEFHPGIGAEVGYDSNWFLRSHKDGPNVVNAAPNAPVRDGGMLRITPSVSFNTVAKPIADGGALEGRAFRFSGTASATYREFFGHQELRDQRNISGGGGLRADINYGRPVGFGVFAGYQRVIQPNAVADPNLAFNRHEIHGGGELIIIPGGGTLDLRGSYTLRAQLFEKDVAQGFTRINHEVTARNRWRFRPRTALFHETSLWFVTYPNAANASLYLNDSTPVRTRFGLTGLLTERLGTTLAAGYGATFQKDTATLQQYDSVLAQAEGVFYLSQSPGRTEPGENTLLLSTIVLGYIHDFQLSFLGNFYESDRLYAKFEYWFGNRAVMNLGVYGERQAYPDVFQNTATGTPAPGTVTGAFDNYRVGGDIFAEYRIVPTVGINTTIAYQQTMSDTQLPAGGNFVWDLNWRRVQAFLGARWFF